jgi:hypothetical protein
VRWWLCKDNVGCVMPKGTRCGRLCGGESTHTESTHASSFLSSVFSVFSLCRSRSLFHLSLLHCSAVSSFLSLFLCSFTHLSVPVSFCPLSLQTLASLCLQSPRAVRLQMLHLIEVYSVMLLRSTFTFLTSVGPHFVILCFTFPETHHQACR